MHFSSFEIQLRKTGSNEFRRAYEVTFVSSGTSVVALIPITQILGGRVGPLPLNVGEETPSNRVYAVLVVIGEEGELTDTNGLCWELSSLTPDTSEVSEVWAKHYVEVMKSVVVHSKPRRAVRDAATTMEILRRRELAPDSVDGTGS